MYLLVLTIGAARTVKMEKKSGSIAVGKTADLFVVDGDPLLHIDDIRIQGAGDQCSILCVAAL